MFQAACRWKYCATLQGQEQRRLRHVASLVEGDIAATVDGLALGPCPAAASQYSRLDVLQKLCDLTRLPGCRSSCQDDYTGMIRLQVSSSTSWALVVMPRVWDGDFMVTSSARGWGSPPVPQK